MPYDVRFDEERALVVAEVTGPFEARDIQAVVAQARQRSQERGWNILYDMRAAEPAGVGSGELFWMPRSMPALRDPEAPRVRAALVHPPQFAELAAFWETTFTNAGLQARAFTEEPAAAAWLGEDLRRARARRGPSRS